MLIELCSTFNTHEVWYIYDVDWCRGAMTSPLWSSVIYMQVVPNTRVLTLSLNVYAVCRTVRALNSAASSPSRGMIIEGCIHKGSTIIQSTE
jgi:hypothetical protein